MKNNTAKSKLLHLFFGCFGRLCNPEWRHGHVGRCFIERPGAKALTAFLLVLTIFPFAVQGEILPQGSPWPIPPGWSPDSNGDGQPEPPANIAVSYLPAVSNFGVSGISFDSSFQDLQGGVARVCSKFADMWNAYAHSPNPGTYLYSAWVWNGTGAPTSYGSGGTPGPAIAGYVYSGMGRGADCSGTFYDPRGFYCESGCTGTRYEGESYACGIINPGVGCGNVLPPRTNDSRRAGALYAYCPIGYQAALHKDPSLDKCALQNAGQVKKPSDGVCTMRIKSLSPYSLESDPLDPDCSDTCLPPNAINHSNGKCELSCPIDPLPELPKGDACTNSLEAGRGKDVNNACTSKLTDEMKKQAQCLADKIQKLALPVPYTEPSATIRTEAYQNHLLAVWKKSIEIKIKVRSDEQKQACAATIADVKNEMEHHGITSDPSSKGNQAPHVLGRAVDIPKDVVKAMKMKVAMIKAQAMTPFFPFCLPCINNSLFSYDVQDYVNSASVNPPSCSLDWGGRFKTHVDPVHFQLP